MDKIYQRHGFADRPEDIWNTDESGFACSEGKTRIICRKGQIFISNIIIRTAFVKNILK